MRARRPEDLPVLLAVLQRTHDEQGYPVRAAAVSADWLADPRELGGWVVDDGVVRGHVALHSADRPSLPLWQEATGRDVAGLAVVSRLFTDRSTPGTGTALLAHTVEQAAARGRRAVLEVDPDSAARDFYLRRGWRAVGQVRQQWGHRLVDSVAMISPA